MAQLSLTHKASIKHPIGHGLTHPICPVAWRTRGPGWAEADAEGWDTFMGVCTVARNTIRATGIPAVISANDHILFLRIKAVEDIAKKFPALFDDLDIEKLVGIVDVSKLCPSSPY